MRRANHLSSVILLMRRMEYSCRLPFIGYDLSGSESKDQVTGSLDSFIPFTDDLFQIHALLVNYNHDCNYKVQEWQNLFHSRQLFRIWFQQIEAKKIACMTSRNVYIVITCFTLIAAVDWMTAVHFLNKLCSFSVGFYPFHCPTGILHWRDLLHVL